jgi:hypothetical protein
VNQRLADEISRKLNGIDGQVLPSKPLDAAMRRFPWRHHRFFNERFKRVPVGILPLSSSPVISQHERPRRLRRKNLAVSLNDPSSDQAKQNGRKQAEQFDSHYVRFVLGRRSRQSKGHRGPHRLVVDSLIGQTRMIGSLFPCSLRVVSA